MLTRIAIALEALLALRVHCGSRLEIQILAPGESFLHRPVSVAEAFDVGDAREFDLTTMLRTSEPRAWAHQKPRVRLRLAKETLALVATVLDPAP